MALGEDHTTYTLLGQLTSRDHHKIVIYVRLPGLFISFPNVFCVLSVQIAPKLVIFHLSYFGILKSRFYNQLEISISKTRRKIGSHRTMQISAKLTVKRNTGMKVSNKKSGNLTVNNIAPILVHYPSKDATSLSASYTRSFGHCEFPR